MVDGPTPSPRRIRLVVLFGGQSAEHDVSRVSARHVLAAVDPDRYDIVPIGITREGRWVQAKEATAALLRGPEALPEAIAAEGPELEPLPALAPTHDDQPVVVVPVMHGPFAEDGTVQGLLELADVPYVGCGVLASAVSMDKAVAKQLLGAAGIPLARWSGVHESDVDEQGRAAVARRVADELGLPVFVKPANMGSSIGVSKARDVDELTDALAVALRYDEWVLAEEAIVGREIECGVLGNLEPRASVPGEIVPGADFYDYEDKYFHDAAQLLVPAPLDEATTAAVQALALQAFRVLRCEGMARVDFFYEEGGRGLLVNEVNTIPGFTPISMYPKMWAASGVSYRELIDELVRLAIERHQRRATRR